MQNIKLVEEENLKRVTTILERYFADDIPEEFIERIQAWLSSDYSERDKDRVLRRVFDEWVKFDPNPGRYAYDTLAIIHNILGFPKKKRLKMPLHRRRSFKVAAVLIPIMCLTTAAYVLKDRDIEQPEGAVWVAESIHSDGVKKISLPDGSEVTMGESTTLTQTGDFVNDRSVSLDGEAFFSVKPLDGKPFTITTNELTVTVLGTEFNVMAYEDREETEVTLESGKVEVKVGEEMVTLDPMTQFVMCKATGSFSVRDVDYREMEVIRSHALIFEDIPLVDLLQRIGRYYGVTMEVVGSGLENRAVRIAFDTNDKVEDVLFVLQAATGLFDYQISGENGVTVTAR